MKLYVGNISYQLNSLILNRLFSPYGTVDEAVVMLDGKTQCSRGFAFVTMGNEEQGRAAIKGLNGRSLDGRELMIREAHPKETRTGVFHGQR